MRGVSRRAFIKTGVATAALSAATRAARAAPNERIGVGVMGCMNRGWQVARSMLQTGRFDIVALCDCDTANIDIAEQRIGDLPARKPRRYQDFRHMLEDAQVQAVVNATPDHWHAMSTLMALEAGKHVFLEKPASFDIADGQAMVAAQQRNPGCVVLIGTQQRSGGHFAEARDFVRSGALGRIAFCRAWTWNRRGPLGAVDDSAPPETLDYDMWLGPAPERPYNRQRVHYNWRFFHDYGTGEMGNWGAHWLDIVRWYMDLGLPERVSGHGGTFVTHDIKEWPDTATVVYHLPELTVLWEQRLWTPGSLHGIRHGAEFSGDKGTLTVSRSGWTWYPADGEPETHGGSEMERAHVNHFADCILNGAKPVADIVDGHRSSVWCHLGNATVRLGRELELDVETERVRGDREANRMFDRKYRRPWGLNV